MATVPLLFYSVSYGGRQVFCGGGTAEFWGCYVVNALLRGVLTNFDAQSGCFEAIFIKIFIKIIGICA